MKYHLILLSIILTLTTSITNAFNTQLAYAIQDTDIETVASLLKNESLSYSDKIQLLDLAQVIIQKRRDETFINQATTDRFSAKNFRLFGIVLTILGGVILMHQLEKYEVEFCIMGSGILTLGCTIAKLAHDYMNRIEQSYKNAVAIKQLIFNAKEK